MKNLNLFYSSIGMVFLSSSAVFGQTFKWTDNAGNNNWVSSSNWNQDPGSGDYPGEDTSTSQIISVLLEGSRWGSGGTNHFDIDLTTSSSLTSFSINIFDISTDGSTDAWLINDGPQQGEISLENRLNTNLGGGGTANIYGDIYLKHTFDKWTTSGNKLILHGQLNGHANANLSSVGSNGGGITLKSSGNFSGDIFLANNTLDIDHVNAVQNSRVNIGTNGTLEYINNTNIAMLAGTGNISLNNTLNIGATNLGGSYSGILSGSGDLRKKGTGTWTLGGSSSGTHSGTLYIDGGSVKLNNGNALAKSKVWINTQNGFDINGNNTTIGALGGAGNLNLGANSLTISGNHNSQHLGVISGTGHITINTNNTQSFGPNNTYNGGTSLTGGTFLSSSEGELGATSGNLTMGNASYHADATHSQSRVLLFAFNATNATFEVDNGKTLTWSGLINDNSPDQTITKTGTGTLAITNDSNTFFGTVNINAGSVTPSPTGLASARMVLNTNNALNLTGADTTLGSLNGSGDFTLETSLTIGNHVPSATYSGHISRTGVTSITKRGGGTQTFSGTSDRIGAVTVNDGTIVLNNPTQTPLGTGTITINTGATLSGSGVGGCPTVVNAGGTIRTLGNSSTLNLAGMNLKGIYSCQISDVGNSKLAVGSNTTISQGTLTLSFPNGALTQDAYVILSYNNLNGTFANIHNLPAGYDINYTYNDGSSSNNIAIVKDTTAPTVVITTAEADPTNADSISYSITFSEPITGFVDHTDFYITGTTVATTDITSTVITNSGDDTHFTLTLNNISGDGLLQFRLNRNVIIDGAGNKLVIDASTPLDPFSPRRTIDNTAPLLSLIGLSTITVHHNATWNDPGATADDSSTVTTGGDTVNTSTPGTYTVTYDATDNAGNIATQITRTVIVLTAYKSWAADKGLTAGVNDGITQDPDKDGSNNLEEFALDGDPLSSANDGKVAIKIVTDDTQHYLQITLPVRNGTTFSGSPAKAGSIDDVQYTLRGSTNLTDWTQTVTEQTATPLTPALSSGWGYRTFRLDLALSTNPIGFLDIKIETTTP